MDGLKHLMTTLMISAILGDELDYTANCSTAFELQVSIAVQILFEMWSLYPTDVVVVSMEANSVSNAQKFQIFFL